MLLNSEELLALVHGDAEPNRLADLLDRLERCPESAAALQVLVTLKAHREEALETLRGAEEHELAATLPHPANGVRIPSGWAMQGLRLAASIAVVGMIGFWALGNPVAPASTVDTVIPPKSLATDTYSNIVTVAPRVQLTTQSELGAIDEARQLIEDERATEAVGLLLALESEDVRADLFLGMAQFFSGQHADALATLSRTRDSDDSFVRRQGQWYEANTLLALDRRLEAAILLAELKGGPQPTGAPFESEAAAKYLEVAAALGLNVTTAR